MKIAYLGFDLLYPCLEALENAGCFVMEVFTCDTDNKYEFNIRTKAFAEKRNIPCHINRITLDDIHRLKKEGCEAIFCAAYYHKVPIDHSLPIVNVHPAMLPVGRGPWPMPVTILRGLPKSGVTLHKMENELDAGDILAQEEFDVLPCDNLETMTEKICEIGARLCTQTVNNFDTYWKEAKPQGEYEYWSEPEKEEYTITPDTTPEKADRILRAFFEFECYLHVSDDSEICVVRGEFVPVKHSLPFGAEIVVDGLGKGYAVSGGAVVIRNL